MSTEFDFFAPSADGFNPGQPSDYNEASIPFDWEIGGISDVTPFQITDLTLDEWLLRYHILKVRNLHIADPSEHNLTFEFEMVRRMINGNTATEEELDFPSIEETFGDTSSDGPFLYEGSGTLNGFGGVPENTAFADLTLHLFAKRRIGNVVGMELQIPHLYRDNDGFWYPSFTVEGTISIQAGSEWSHTFRSFVDPDETGDPTLTSTGSFSPSHGGGPFALRVFSDAAFEATSASVEIIPVGWLGWDGLFSTISGLPL